MGEASREFFEQLSGLRALHAAGARRPRDSRQGCRRYVTSYQRLGTTSRHLGIAPRQNYTGASVSDFPMQRRSRC
jgi:hypothetical protein